uniref:CCHC-type domain-containing protein n=1 Tax=Electrophorus electricus TaxID=8005 RepID=A0A4W4F4G2_ELEEL
MYGLLTQVSKGVGAFVCVCVGRALHNKKDTVPNANICSRGPLLVTTERVLFIREVLFGVLGLTPGDLICAQRNGPLGFYDVTLSTTENYRRVLDWRVELQHHPVGKYYVVDPLWDRKRRVVTTHVFNPHVPTDLIRRFLQEYDTVHPGERMVRDELGIWNGRHQYQMSFKEDGKGGLVHPPALFAIDGNRGYLFYRDQPVFCRSCRGHGHKMEDCPELECLNCLEKGHLARDCRGPRRCRRCRSEGHLAPVAGPEEIEAQILDPVKEERVEEPLSRDQALQVQNGQLETGRSQETEKAPAVVRKRMRASWRIPGEDSRLSKAKRAGKGEAAPKGPLTFTPGSDSTGSFPSPSPLVIDFDSVGDGGGNAQKPGKRMDVFLNNTGFREFAGLGDKWEGGSCFNNYK